MGRVKLREVHFHYTNPKTGNLTEDIWSYKVCAGSIDVMSFNSSIKRFSMNICNFTGPKSVKWAIIDHLGEFGYSLHETYKQCMEEHEPLPKTIKERAAMYDTHPLELIIAHEDIDIDIEVLSKLSENVFKKGWGKKETVSAMLINGIDPLDVITIISQMRKHKVVDKRVSRKLLDILRD